MVKQKLIDKICNLSYFLKNAGAQYINYPLPDARKVAD